MIVLIGGCKGGTGKSTITTNLAAYLAGDGQDFILVDADDPRQASSARWVERRSENVAQLIPVRCVQATGNVYQTLCDLEQRYGTVLVDAGGKDSKELRTAMAAAHKMYVPLQASQLDLESLAPLCEMIEQAREALNPSLEVVAVLSKAPSNPSNTEIPEARELLSVISGIRLSGEIIRDRKVYREAVRDGRGAIEMTNSTARAEIQLLAQEIFGHE